MVRFFLWQRLVWLHMSFVWELLAVSYGFAVGFQAIASVTGILSCCIAWDLPERVADSHNPVMLATRRA